MFQVQEPTKTNNSTLQKADITIQSTINLGSLNPLREEAITPAHRKNITKYASLETGSSVILMENSTKSIVFH